MYANGHVDWAVHFRFVLMLMGLVNLLFQLRNWAIMYVNAMDPSMWVHVDWLQYPHQTLDILSMFKAYDVRRQVNSSLPPSRFPLAKRSLSSTHCSTHSSHGNLSQMSATSGDFLGTDKVDSPFHTRPANSSTDIQGNLVLWRGWPGRLQRNT